MAKRSKYDKDDNNLNEDYQMSVDDKILSSDIDSFIQMTTAPSTYPYHTSICGSILYSSPTNSPSHIFSFIRHGNFNALQRSLEVYSNDIIRMRNDHGQTVLHLLVIHAYQYMWVRLLMLRGSDPCAQDVDGYTAVHYAVERDDIEMLKALTLRFYSEQKAISEEEIIAIHEKCCKSLTLRENHGLTVFMLACQHESLKCLDFLIALKINDSNLEDKYGDTCLHYAVARRNQILIEKLINTCKADVNGGDKMRPTVLDVLQYNRTQQPSFQRNKDDEIEQLLLSHDAKNRCSLRRVVGKRKGATDNDESVIPNLACLSIDLTANPQLETARSHARMGASLQAKGDLKGAQESYKNAMMYALDDTLDWATYAFHAALVHIVHGERQLALELLQKALHIRKELEKNSEDIDRIQLTIDRIQQPIS